MKIEMIDSEIALPAVPSICPQEDKDALDLLMMKEIELEDCLSYNNWVHLQLDASCQECAKHFAEQIDMETIVLQASELRIVEKLDSLYLLEDPVVNGEPQSLDDFVKQAFKEFKEQNIPNEVHEIAIKDLPDDCPEEVK